MIFSVHSVRLLTEAFPEPPRQKGRSPLTIVVNGSSARRTERRNRNVHGVHEDFDPDMSGQRSYRFA